MRFMPSSLLALNLDVAYGPAIVSYTQAFTSDGIDSGHTLDLAYDMGNDLSISGTVNKDTPRLVLGIRKSF